MRNPSLITLNDPHSMVAESYKMLRTNLHYMQVGGASQTIIITSSFTQEGKTTSIVNTAIAFAQADKKVLLIDCDLRKARVHQLLDLNQSPGLTHYLADSLPIANVIQRLEEVKGLDVLTAGVLPPNPAELLATPKMQALLADAKEHYDYILIDTPPVLSVTDTMVLSRFVDGIILVVAAHETKTEELKKAKKSLDKVGAKILGVVMTKADLKGKKYYQYYGEKRGKAK